MALSSTSALRTTPDGCGRPFCAHRSQHDTVQRQYSLRTPVAHRVPRLTDLSRRPSGATSNPRGPLHNRPGLSRQGTTGSCSRSSNRRALGAQEDAVTGFLWIVFVGLIAGIIARFLLPGPNNPQGFVLTTVLGIAGAFVATWIGQTIGWYRPDQGAGIIGATLGALIVLVVWHRLVVQRVVNDPAVSGSNWPPSRP